MKKLWILLIVIFLLKTSYSQIVCDPISTFPWTEGFEEVVENGTCWTQKGDWDGQVWTVVDNLMGPPPAAHSGNYKAFISLYCNSDSGHERWFISPIFDLSEVDDPVLSFFHIALGGSYLIFLYKDSSDRWMHWQLFSYDVMDWQKEVVHLPNKSSNYQFALAAIHGGSYGEIQLDDIFVSDGEIKDLSVLSHHTDNFSVSPNPVQDYISISGIEPQTITLYDAIGRIVLTQTDYTNSIDVSHLPQGLYFLHIISDKGTVFTKKFLKK